MTASSPGPSTTPPQPRARLGALGRPALALFLLLLPTACTAPRPASSAAPVDPYATLPSWRYEPLSWAKLDALESWLAAGGDGPEGLRAEAQLQLAEGRVAFANKEPDVDPRVVEARLGAALDGFRQVLEDPEASRDQLARASAGLARARSVEAPRPAAGPAPVSRSRWGAGSPNPARLTAHQGAWSRITVHHSAISTSVIGGSDLGSTAHHLRTIQRNQMKSEGMGDIGYHFLISPSGAVYEGRSLRWRGAHAGGRNNVANLGICLLGNFDVERPSALAVQALAQLVDQLRSRYGIQRSAVYGHKELKGTVCPGVHVQRWVNGYRRGTGPLADAGALPVGPALRPTRSASVR